ncbi:ATPase WRNIP1-like protein [Lachnellula willkommii]|uniref:ATPase WRNIP1-like protein n=1 Tax=Lachnellula willkommii TaxID=215461 RepID=A0A559MF89_9HELO|nr:ATPase WRNIP1-like protein [Lachnellula willkommii]
MVDCPICSKGVKGKDINNHIDSGCQSFLETSSPPLTQQNGNSQKPPATQKASLSNFFQTPAAKRSAAYPTPKVESSPGLSIAANTESNGTSVTTPRQPQRKRSFEDIAPGPPIKKEQKGATEVKEEPPTKKPKITAFQKAAPLAERMRPRSLDECIGQELVGPQGVLRSLIEQDRVPSMILWGGAGTGKTTIARCIASMVGSRFVEINSTSSGKLTDEDILQILERALGTEGQDVPRDLIDSEFLKYLSSFSDGDARTALNLLELAMSLSNRPSITKEEIKAALTKTLVYDRAGDQHYDTISAFHKSVRGSDPDAALYYLARMLQSGEDPLYVARRMVVIASEDVGLADNSMLSLATSAYTAAEKIGMPECRIALAHATVALCLAPKSTRAYRGLNNAYAALREPGVASLPIPIHLRNAPTKLMKELGYGDQYKYNPNYKEGKVVQEYLPDQLQGRSFLEDRDLGTEIDPGAWR